ncbi:hypothetical protein EDB84DRAFT_1567252 [Lactarius hengduanensis]|nr:hypothetical protein EDB84DRAFT_1567252 [Lactarius hengduanensis]
MPPKPRKLAATSGPGKPAGGATTRSSTATTTPGAASSKTPAPLPTAPSGASATPEVKPTGMYSFLHKQPTYTPPPVYTPELAAAVTPKDLIDAMAVDDDSTSAPPRPLLTAFLHKKLVVTSESTPVAADRESEEPTVPAVASDTQQPTPVRDSSSAMVEAAKMRNKILEKAMGEIYKRQPGNSQFNKKEAKQKIKKWYYNHYNPPHRQVIKFVRRWSARNVFYHEDKVDIMKLAEDMSRAAPGMEAFLGSIQLATTELWKKLPVEEQERFAQTADEWSDNGPPKGIQAKMASAAIRGQIVRDFQTQLYRTCGARSIVLLAYQKEDGTPQVSMDEWNADVGGGMDFNDFCPKWRSTVLWDTWKKYGRKCFEQDDDQNAQKDLSRTIKIPVQITTNKKTGEPEIPSIVKGGGHQTKVVQTALRGYCTAHIRFISGKPYATIPWAKLSTTPTAWIQEECYPPGFKWADPSKIRLNDVHDLLIYWRQRKEDGLDPLIWNPSCELLADSDLEKTSKHLPARRRHQNASTSDVDGDEENYAQELNNITDNSSVLPLPPPPPSLHPVQRGPAGSDTEGLEQAGIGSA